MELGLSLGESTPNPCRFLPKAVSEKQNHTNNNTDSKSCGLGLDFCMGLGINPMEEEKSKENDGDADDDRSSGEDTASDDHRASASVGGGGGGSGGGSTPLQLHLLPLAPVPLWNSGSSDNGSSGNAGRTTAKGFDVNQLPPGGSGVAEEATSPNSAASAFRMDFSIFRGGEKRKDGAGALGIMEGVDAAERASSRVSDEDENGLNGRKKLRLTKEQSAFLEESFKEHSTLNPKQKLALAKQLNLRPRQVEVWFQNRRARTKLKQTEVDCEYLKRCCETLTEENKRLHKELQELRALKTSNPFYLQVPATTLTMCPSCERVATTSTAPPTTASNPVASTATAAASATVSTPKALSFPFPRPTRMYPFSQTSHPHQSTA